MSARIDVHAPAQAEGSRASLSKWLKAVGDPIGKDDPLAELETDKVAVEVSAPVAGVVAELLAVEGADVEPGALIARLTHIPSPTPLRGPPPRSGEDVRSSPEREGGPPKAVEGSGANAPVNSRLSPAVRRALAERGLSADAITGTGRDGRLTLADVETHTAPTAPATSPTAVPGTRRVPHTPMRRRIAERMARSVAEAPHVTAVFEADFTAVLAHRARHKAASEAAGGPLTITAYIVAACVAAMRAQPAVNAAWGDDAVTLFDDINIGVGTALGDAGLVVPVVHRAQQLSLQGIAARLGDVTARARAGKLAPADVADGTFTISNHGVSGSLFASPVILVPPQVAILGVGKLEKRVVVREAGGADAIQVRPMAYVSLTIDHRALDGHQTNAWLTAFVAAIEGWTD